MKVAPIIAACRRSGRVQTQLVHTGQHYDERMSDLFFRDLGLPAPDVNLEVGSGSHAHQTAEVMKRFEPICFEHRPEWIVVVGDVNSTLACALVASKLGIKVAHVEAGLRSFDRTMPEEINRVLTDGISDLLFVTEASGVDNLRREGISDERVRLVGNVMADTLLANREKAERSKILDSLELKSRGYGVVTLHRPSNVDEPQSLASLIKALLQVCEKLPLVFPVHPRTRGKLESLGLAAGLSGKSRLRLIEPLGYLDFLKLMAHAEIMLTDSGGIQEETTILGVSCLTLRDNTERPVTLTQGTNRLIGTRPENIVRAFQDVRENPPIGKIPVHWDGHAAVRIVECLLGKVQEEAKPGAPPHSSRPLSPRPSANQETLGHLGTAKGPMS